jgi:hypothetical protein
MRAFGSVADSSVENADVFIKLLSKHDPKLKFSIYAASLSFVRNCRRKVEYIRRVYSRLESIRTSLCTAWAKEVGSNVEGIDLSGARNIREAVIVIEELIVQYVEFSVRAEIASPSYEGIQLSVK